MLTYLIDILSLKNSRIDCTQTKKLTDMKTNSWTQKQRKILKNQHGLLSMMLPRYRVFALSTKCGVCQPAGLIVASLYKI